MALADVESSDQRLEAQARLWNHLFSYVNSMSLKCAVEMGIPDIIHNHGKPISLSDLASAIPIPVAKTDHLHRLLRLLVHTGMLSVSDEKHKGETEKVEEITYSLTPATSLLVKDKNNECLSPFLLMMLDSSLMNPWLFLSQWFTKDGASSSTTPFGLCHGKNIWEHANRAPEFNHAFNEAMASDSQFLMSTLTTKCAHVFDGLNSLVDVGGGTGAAARALAGAFPKTRVTVLDLPHVVAGLPADSSAGVNFEGGDMFQWIPPTDAVFLKWILHDWNDEKCVKILRKCKEAIFRTKDKGGGKVIIVDMVVNSNKSDHMFTETQLFMDLLVCTVYTSKEREEGQWKKLFQDAGFSGYKITPILGLRSLIEVFP
ncbi:hypothetical protein H6P81_013884 [Aristolochia fimbriata]|uniref:Uncharacterized protein n=1 Tax=Aristolochia fimbriata TaxID=158543 RepID=A0AAV7EH64_ARIFI|nr:hypothetical protein H6P81_013884 [Aristolochia fimbriata]